MSDIEWPTREEFFAAMDHALCPWCGAGPFRSPAGHTQRMHGASADAMRQHYGLQGRDREATYYFSEHKVPCDGRAGHLCESCPGRGGDGEFMEWCPFRDAPKSEERARGDAVVHRQAEAERKARNREAEHRAMWAGFLGGEA